MSVTAERTSRRKQGELETAIETLLDELVSADERLRAYRAQDRAACTELLVPPEDRPLQILREKLLK